MPLYLAVGNKGMGKTSFLAYQCKKAYFERGELLKEKSAEIIGQLNRDYKLNLTPPKDVPIFTSPKLKMKFIVDYNTYFEPYMVNPYFLGVRDNSGKPSMFMPPSSIYFVPELQRVLNSRKSASFPERLSQWFEESRQWDIEFWGDGQRGHLMDLNFRALTDKIFEMQGVENEKDIIGNVIRTTWHCREFSNLRDYDEYINKNANTYEETTYEHAGNIFECYDSKGCKIDYVPPKGQDFAYMKHLTHEEIQALPADKAKYYSLDEPKWFRGSNDENR